MKNKIFENEVAIITGGASGIGKSICQYLAGQGLKVIIADINYVVAREVASSITSAGGDAKAMSVDVTSAEEVESLIKSTCLEYGRIDILFNNAGMAINGEFQDMSPDHWRQIMQVNLWSVVYGCMYAYPLMMRQGYGQIINTASWVGPAEA